jgi:hypothetical protein
MHVLNSANPNEWDLLLFQEPWLDYLRNTRANHYWRVVYPPSHFNDGSPPSRSVLLVNTNISSDFWEALPTPTSDITAIKIKTNSGLFSIFNIYVDCTNNSTIVGLSDYLNSNYPNYEPNNEEHFVWCGDFNRHHLTWEEQRNAHLFSREVEVRPLIDLADHFCMTIQLPPGIPTLESLATGNWTRPDNVWCSSHTSDLFSACNVNPEIRPPNTDHLPIVSYIDFPVRRLPKPKDRNFRKVNWDSFNQTLTESLNAKPKPKPLTSKQEFDNALKALSDALATTIEQCVPHASRFPFTKRWWSKELETLRLHKNKLSNLHYHF